MKFIIASNLPKGGQTRYLQIVADHISAVLGIAVPVNNVSDGLVTLCARKHGVTVDYVENHKEDFRAWISGQSESFRKDNPTALLQEHHDGPAWGLAGAKLKSDAEYLAPQMLESEYGCAVFYLHTSRDIRDQRLLAIGKKVPDDLNDPVEQQREREFDEFKATFRDAGIPWYDLNNDEDLVDGENSATRTIREAIHSIVQAYLHDPELRLA